MTKHTKGVITVVAAIAIIAAGYHFFHRTAKKYAKIIIDFNGSSLPVTQLVNTHDEAFLKAWAKALTKDMKDFSYRGEIYNPKDGKKIVKSTA